MLDFLRRAYVRMVEVDGVDRAIAIGALAFTALFPLLIVYASAISIGDGFDLADRLIGRFDLSGSSADSVRTAFGAPEASSTATVLGGILAVATALSFTRAMQRLYESCWGLERRGFRGSGWGLLWLAVLLVWLFTQPALSVLPAGVQLTASLALAALLWLSAPYLLLGRRIHYRRLAVSAVLTTAALTLAGWGSAIAMPEIVAESSDQFGTIGVAFALLAWLTALSMAIMGCAVAGAELARAGWRAGPD